MFEEQEEQEAREEQEAHEALEAHDRNKFISLNRLEPGRTAVVHEISSEGSMRRRLLDIGLIRGTEVKCVGRSPAGDPSAYMIRGSIIALRAADAEKIIVDLTAALPGIAAEAASAPEAAPGERGPVIAVAGNPNVGKSTLFNSLTGMRQHTGNWTGKTVATARGHCTFGEISYTFVDIPGTYSLMAHSPEEEVARDFICFGGADAVLLVCDATCLERNMNLVLQTLEITKNVLICVNLMDEAKRRKIYVDISLIARRLGVPVIGITAREKSSRKIVLGALDKMFRISTTPRSGETEKENAAGQGNEEAAEAAGAGDISRVKYPSDIERALSALEPAVRRCGTRLDPRWVSLRLLCDDRALVRAIKEYEQKDILQYENVRAALADSRITAARATDSVCEAIVSRAEEICRGAVVYDSRDYRAAERKADSVLTGKRLGYPIMTAMLAVILWLTVAGANYPSELLSSGLFWLQDKLTAAFEYVGAPSWLHGALVLGVYRVLAWVVSVMLPPMAIFFPLFTLMEDAGYLPRVAYNLDRPFRCCRACGKQALTMCMGLGCNAVGVTGCRIIDSPRERLIAILTNNFIPCNGRFPAFSEG